MPNIKFGGSDKSETREHSIEVYNNQHNEIYLSIELGYEASAHPSWVVLDIDTAIQFSKQLRKSIANAKINSDG